MRVLYFARDYTPHDHRFRPARKRARPEEAFASLRLCVEDGSRPAIPHRLRRPARVAGRGSGVLWGVWARVKHSLLVVSASYISGECFTATMLMRDSHMASECQVLAA